MIVAAHQPSYLPWLGYFDKLAKADLFVVMDHLQFEAQNFQNRNRIKLNTGPAWITVPVERGSQADTILDKKIQNTSSAKEHWQRKTWLTIENNYRRAPFFDHYADELKDVYTRPWERLVDLDLHILTLACKWFGIHRPIVRSSTLDLCGQKTDMLIDLCRKVGADAYLTGSGGSQDYLDAERMGRQGIGVHWQQFDHPEYSQRYPHLGFVSNLAFLDLLLNCGPASRDVLFAFSHPLRVCAEAS
jgi:hypothetical protein